MMGERDLLPRCPECDGGWGIVLATGEWIPHCDPYCSLQGTGRTDDSAVARVVLATTDANVWAREFSAMFNVWKRGTELPMNRADSEGLMQTWFACAIETGRTEGEKGDETGTEFELYVAGVISTFPPFDQFHPARCLPMAKTIVAAIGDWEPSDD